MFPSHCGHIRGAAVGLQDEVAVLLGGEVALERRELLRELRVPRAARCALVFKFRVWSGARFFNWIPKVQKAQTFLDIEKCCKNCVLAKFGCYTAENEPSKSCNFVHSETVIFYAKVHFSLSKCIKFCLRCSAVVFMYLINSSTSSPISAVKWEGG